MNMLKVLAEIFSEGTDESCLLKLLRKVWVLANIINDWEVLRSEVVNEENEYFLRLLISERYLLKFLVNESRYAYLSS